MPELSPDEQNFLKKRMGVSAPLLTPDEDSFLAKMQREAPKHEVAVTGQGSAIPNWDAKREALDSLSDGKLAQSPAAHVAQASWRKENPTLALEMRELPGPTLLFLASTVAGRGILAASEAAGAPGLGELLTGTFGRNISGPLGYLARGASKMLAGAGQGALAQAVYPGQQGYGGSAVEGALTNLAGGALAAPLRNDISPEVADLARKTILQGVPVRTGQLPGSSFASRAAGKLLRMTKPDASALTSRVIASMGHNADILNGDTVDAAQDKIGQGFQTVASRIPQNIADPQLFSDLRSVAMNAHNGLAGQQTNHDAMLGAMRQIYSAASNGAIDGPTYLNLTQTGSALSNLQKSGKPLAQYANAARDALDDALQRAAPQESQQIQLLRNQYRNSVILDKLKDKATDANGVIDPKKLFNAVVGNYGGTSEASAAAANAGNSVDIGTLAAGGNRFPQQPATHMTLPGAVGLGAMGGTALGLGEMEGFPLIEKAMEHPVMGLGLGALSAGYLGAGGLQNSSAYTNLLLSRAARNASPMLGGANPLVPMVHEAYRGDGTSPAPPPGPTQQSGDNWNRWLRAQSFLESPNGLPSATSSAKGFFQFVNGTAQKAVDAGLPDPRAGKYEDQANATQQYIQHFYPDAASAINNGDFATATKLLRNEWPSLPGGSQMQSPGQYRRWMSILGDETPATLVPSGGVSVTPTSSWVPPGGSYGAVPATPSNQLTGSQ